MPGPLGLRPLLLAALLLLAVAGAALGADPCYVVDFQGTQALSNPTRTVFTYHVWIGSGCPAPTVFSLSSLCPVNCAYSSRSSTTPAALNPLTSLYSCTWSSIPAGPSPRVFEVVVDGTPSIATGQWAIRSNGDISLGYTCVPGCDQEPTEPNVGEPCVLVIPASITLPNTGRVQVQVSLQAVPDGEVNVAITSDCAFLNLCTLTFNPTNWNVPQIFRASNDPSNPDRTCNINLVATGTNDCEGTINVTKADAPRTESVSYGDPYVFTFDGVRFRLTQTTSGDDYYYLLRQPDGELIVQTYVVPCAIGECNRGVAIRYRTAVFFLDMASNGATTPSDNGLLALEGIVVTQPAAGAYLLSLNSQAAIRLTPELIASMNVYSLRVSIRLGTYYRSNVAGLVGNFNSNRNDERRLPDGTQAPDLPTFENGWKVPPAEVLFNNPAAPIGTLFGAQPYTAQTFPFVCEAS